MKKNIFRTREGKNLVLVFFSYRLSTIQMLKYTYVCIAIKISIIYLQQEWWQRADIATKSKKMKNWKDKFVQR